MSERGDVLQRRLSDLAEEWDMPVQYTQVRRRARRLRRRRTVTAGAAAVVVAALAMSGVLLSANIASPMPAATPDGPFLGWSALGNATGSELVTQALQVWDARSGPGASSATGRHTEAHPLLVDRNDDILGPVVIIEARDARGDARLALFTGSFDNRAVLQLRADRPAPDPSSTRVVSMVTARVNSTPGTLPAGSRISSWLVALGAPGVTRLAYHSTAVDQQLSEGGAPASGRYILVSLPSEATPINTWMTAYHAKSVVFRGLADSGAVGDAVAVPARVVERKSDGLRIECDEPGILAVGQLVATPDGLLGRINRVSGGTLADVDVLASHSFTISALTDITYQPVRVIGGPSIQIDQVPEDAHISVTNRIVVADPAQHSDRFGTVTLGRVASLATTVHPMMLTPAVNPADATQVFVMVDEARYTDRS